MAHPSPPRFEEKTLDALTIEDEKSFRHVGLYEELKSVLVRDGYRFRILHGANEGRWDRALFLNLTFWGTEGGGDVLVDDHIAADVVAHVAWHHLAKAALAGPTGHHFGGPQAGPPGAAGSPSRAPSAASLFLGEAIASAFDLYLVGRLIGHAPQSTFLETQIPAMAETTEAAGLSEEGFEQMLAEVAADPERAFEDLRQLLCDASAKLSLCTSPLEALTTLGSFEGHRFAPLLHRYELSNWILYARAYGDSSGAKDVIAEEVDRTLRNEPVALAWLERHWLARTP